LFQRVVNGDDALQAAVGVDDGEGEEFVALELVGGFFNELDLLSFA